MDYLKTLYGYRELIVNLAIKDFKVRYKSAVLGFVWMLLNPVLQMIVLSVVFSIYVKIRVDVPYPLFLLCGLLPWNFLSMSLGAGAHSLVEESNLVKKVYFPREIIPISIVSGHLINFLTALILFLPFPIVMLGHLDWPLLYLPIPLFLLTLFVIGLTALVSNFDVFFRDTRYIAEAVTLVWFYATPIFYPVDKVPAGIQLYFKLNPMVGIVEMFRSILLYGRAPQLEYILYVGVVTAVLIGISVWLYRRRGPIMADHL
jgi:homopolymeric O-antigen transport system permease protein